MATSRPPLVLGVGEALFDCFPDGPRLGGAPVNLVVHLNTLLQPIGGKAAPLTRVGDDALGRRLVSDLQHRGIDTGGVQVDRHRPTGTVDVLPRDDGETAYRFADNTAWDALEPTTDGIDLARACNAIAFGTLAQRSAVSTKTIEAILQAAPQAVRLLDVNLRQEFYDQATIERSFRLATAVKLNAAELATATQLLGLEPTAESLVERFQLDWLAVTNGSAGTLVVADGASFKAEVPSYDPNPSADSVGAGDACAAGLLFGVLCGWDWPRSVALANRLGAYVASQPGATPPLPADLLPTGGDDADAR